jgi:hypothetical protein
MCFRNNLHLQLGPWRNGELYLVAFLSAQCMYTSLHAFQTCRLIFFSISSYLQKIDSLRWTPHMEGCLQTLAKKQECPTDEVLVQPVRLQLIVEKVAQAPWHDGEIETAELIRAPPAFYLKALQSQLQEVKRKLSPESQRNGKLPSTNYFYIPF